MAHEASLVDAGRVITGGGVSLCIDATLHILERVLGPDVASETARIIEYDRARGGERHPVPRRPERVRPGIAQGAKG